MARACHPAELGDVSSVWKGRSHHFSSSHPSPPHPVTGATGLPATRSRIYYPGRRGLASGRHSQQSPPPPPQQPAKTLGVSSWLLQLVHRALLLQSQHRAQNPVSPRDGARAGHLQEEGAGSLPPPDSCSWILQPQGHGAQQGF